MASSSSSLQINDPVHVTRDSGKIEGVVAFLGPVEFDQQHGDWVGVRLTGPSVGLGKNDGSVQGKSYFSCPPNCGVFVRESHVTKRNLTRLEALRLKRELAAGAVSGTSSGSAGTSANRSGVRPGRAAAAAATAASTPTKESTGTSSLRSTPTKTATRTVTQSTNKKADSTAAITAEVTVTTPPKETSTSSVPLTAGKARLEELRKRRAVLEERKAETVLDKPEDTTTSTTIEKNNAAILAELERARHELQVTAEQFKAKEAEAASLQQKLSKAEQEIHNAKNEIVSLQEEMEQKEAATREQQAAAAAVPKPSAVRTAPAPVADAILQEKDEQIQKLINDNVELKERLEESLQEVTNLRQDLNREKNSRAAEQDELTKARAEASTFSKELQALSDQTTQRGASDASHYKERAKLQAEISALNRKIEEMGKDKTELENTIEDLTLDKEQLQEEKDTLEDRYEELKIDAETAQIQADELRLELEEAQMAAERAASISTDTTSGTANMDAEDKAQALAVQNARLREALIRLREQSSVDKMEFQRQFRTAEKDAEAGRALVAEVESLRSLKANFEEQISDLKDMVEQGAAFEGMVEDLSDRVLTLEEDIVLLQTTIREMEEAAELTAEMEEVQAEELKALSQDLEGRDTIIRNLEEAIKMQRRREEDLRRTITNYRTTVDTLKVEKQALLELQQGGEGEKSNLIASSQKALAKAAQLVADAAAMRKREAQAVVDKIDSQIYRYLSSRLESLFPQSSVATEVAAIKGELLASKVVNKASQSLAAISKWFSENTLPALLDSTPTAASADTNLRLSDEMKAAILAMQQQTEFAQEITKASCNVMRFLAAGQWPDEMPPEASADLGSLLGHTLLELDSVLGQVLQSLKEEGRLTPEQANIELLQQTTRNAVQSLETDLHREDGKLLASDWMPPGLKLMNDISLAKFACLGTSGALSMVINDPEQSAVGASIHALFGRVEQCTTQVSSGCLRLANLDIGNTELVAELESLVLSISADSEVLLQTVNDMILSGGELSACEAAVDTTLRNVGKLSAALRSANLNQNDDGSYHTLSPEVDDTWGRLSSMVCSLRAMDGDVDDVNYRSRARKIESRLEIAIENEPKLETAQTKISSLEKSLASRSKEIAMQNARLSELERVLAKSNMTVSRSSDLKSSEEYNSLKEENRMLTEAMEVLQRQVDEYDRVVKGFKSPKRGAPPSATRTPRRRAGGAASLDDIGSPAALGAGLQASASNPLSLEATLFRPALQQALQESWKWKAAATSATMSKLTPLPTLFSSEGIAGSRNDDLIIQLSSALHDIRRQKATIKLVNLRDTRKTPRAQLQETRMACLEATRKLETLAMRCRAKE